MVPNPQGQRCNRRGPEKLFGQVQITQQCVLSMHKNNLSTNYTSDNTIFHIQKTAAQGTRFPSMRYEFRFSRRLEVRVGEIRSIIQNQPRAFRWTRS